MSEIRDKIFQELDAVEALAASLRASSGGAKTQTDLENAILMRQLADLQTKNQKAQKYIDQSIDILKRTTMC